MTKIIEHSVNIKLGYNSLLDKFAKLYKTPGTQISDNEDVKSVFLQLHQIWKL